MAEFGGVYDKLGYELASTYKAPEQNAAQSELFTEACSQPDAPDGEPVFWQEGVSADPTFYPDEAPRDGVQADAVAGWGKRRAHHKRSFKYPKLDPRGGGALDHARKPPPEKPANSE